jgi:hypothetical protein
MSLHLISTVGSQDRRLTDIELLLGRCELGLCRAPVKTTHGKHFFAVRHTIKRTANISAPLKFL